MYREGTVLDGNMAPIEEAQNEDFDNMFGSERDSEVTAQGRE